MADRIMNTVTRACATIAAFWAMALAFLILWDITGRTFFNAPFDGTIEIVSNSIVSILFLQLPYTIYRGSHLRTTVVYQNLNEVGRRAIDALVALLGIWFFFSVAYGGWEDMVVGWAVDEREGQGSINVPTYPVRTLIIVFAALSIVAYLFLLWHSLFGGEPAPEEGHQVEIPL